MDLVYFFHSINTSHILYLLLQNYSLLFSTKVLKTRKAYGQEIIKILFALSYIKHDYLQYLIWQEIQQEFVLHCSREKLRELCQQKEKLEQKIMDHCNKLQKSPKRYWCVYSNIKMTIKFRKISVIKYFLLSNTKKIKNTVQILKKKIINLCEYNI